MSFQLQRGSELSSGNAEICRTNDELLHFLGVRCRLGVGSVDALLDQPHDSLFVSSGSHDVVHGLDLEPVLGKEVDGRVAQTDLSFYTRVD